MLLNLSYAFDRDPFYKVMLPDTIVTWSNYKCSTKFTLLSGAVVLLHILFMHESSFKMDMPKVTVTLTYVTVHHIKYMSLEYIGFDMNG